MGSGNPSLQVMEGREEWITIGTLILLIGGLLYFCPLGCLCISIALLLPTSNARFSERRAKLTLASEIDLAVKRQNPDDVARVEDVIQSVGNALDFESRLQDGVPISLVAPLCDAAGAIRKSAAGLKDYASKLREIHETKYLRLSTMPEGSGGHKRLIEVILNEVKELPNLKDLREHVRNRNALLTTLTCALFANANINLDMLHQYLQFQETELRKLEISTTAAWSESPDSTKPLELHQQVREKEQVIMGIQENIGERVLEHTQAAAELGDSNLWPQLSANINTLYVAEDKLNELSRELIARANLFQDSPTHRPCSRLLVQGCDIHAIIQEEFKAAFEAL
eukprot:GHVU01003757.1.p1 GENE.GHVU01003757.1~~GHVU01003757.1.p1  ORF type:complete len:340 (-),score=29.32 GHVU01003757.1:186-1205(-)